jgi:CBS domain-containing protein
MKVKSAMHRGIECAKPNTPVRQIASRMRKSNIGAVPVARNGALVGMITDRDITCRAVAKGRNLNRLTAQDVMTPRVAYCGQDDDLVDAVAAMKKKRIRRLPVVDKSKAVVGMLSLGDVSRKATRSLSGDVLRAVSAHHA